MINCFTMHFSDVNASESSLRRFGFLKAAAWTLERSLFNSLSACILPLNEFVWRSLKTKDESIDCFDVGVFTEESFSNETCQFFDKFVLVLVNVTRDYVTILIPLIMYHFSLRISFRISNPFLWLDREIEERNPNENCLDQIKSVFIVLR